MVKKARIQTIDYKKGTCRVRYQDNQLLSKELVLIGLRKANTGDVVMVVEDDYAGVCFVDLYKEDAL